MSLSILVVNDSAVMRSMLVRTLRLSGLPLSHVYQAADGPEALAVLAAHDVDLAMIDGALPEVSGPRLVEQIKADGRLAGLQIIVVAREGAGGAVRALETRGLASISMPFTPEQVRATVLRSLGVLDS